MKKVLRILVPASILLFLVWTLVVHWSTVAGKITSANPIPLFISLLVLILTFIGGAYFWYKILQVLSVRISFKEAFRIFIISNFGRFIPGVVVHYVARVYFAKGLGLSVSESLSSVFLEAYYTLIGALIVSMLSLPTVLKLVTKTSVDIWLSWVLATTILVLIVVIPTKKIFVLFSRMPILGRALPPQGITGGFKEHLMLIGISTNLFLLYGIGFYLLSASLIGSSITHILDFSGLLSTSWIIGFLTPVAPGGLGVSDLTFAFLLTPFYSFSVASFLALAFRLGLLLAESIVFLVVIKLFGLEVTAPGKNWRFKNG